jgi:hypothetical protein
VRRTRRGRACVDPGQKSDTNRNKTQAYARMGNSYEMGFKKRFETLMKIIRRKEQKEKYCNIRFQRTICCCGMRT